MEKDLENNNTLLEWQALEFQKYEKDASWFLIAGAVFLTFFLIMIAMKNFFGAIVILLISILIYIYSKKEPRLIYFAINKFGVIINERFYSFQDLKSFWIFENLDYKELVFTSNKSFNQKIHLSLGETDSQKVREILNSFIEEEEDEESLIDIFSRYFKF